MATQILFQKTIQFNIIPLLNKLYLSYRSILRFAFEIYMPDNFLKFRNCNSSAEQFIHLIIVNIWLL